MRIPGMTMVRSKTRIEVYESTLLKLEAILSSFHASCSLTFSCCVFCATVACCATIRKLPAMMSDCVADSLSYWSPSSPIPSGNEEYDAAAAADDQLIQTVVDDSNDGVNANSLHAMLT